MLCKLWIPAWTWSAGEPTSPAVPLPRSRSVSADPVWRSLVTLPQRWTAPAFPFKAAQFIARGVAKGSQLGAAMRAAEAAWAAPGIPADAAARAAIADRAARGE